MRLIQHPTGRTQTPMNCYEIRQSWPLKKNSRMSKLLREVQPDDLDRHRARLPEVQRLFSQSRRGGQAPVSIKSRLDRHRARLPEVQRLFSQLRRGGQAPVSIKSRLDRHRARLPEVQRLFSQSRLEAQVARNSERHLQPILTQQMIHPRVNAPVPN
uniref:(northern house mosquito) hypothetical protein n=1 Tax=Culex pipiens TaxID=7175 RepID=A0A8D8MM77_CULPI